MAYHFDPYDEAIVIDGWENGIGDSPYQGLSDMRNVNIISVPGEGSVGFATSKISPPALTFNVTSADAVNDTITYTTVGAAESSMAIVFSATTIGGISTGVPYWIGNTSSTSSKLYSDFQLLTLVNITSDGTGTATTYTMSQPKYFTHKTNLVVNYTFMVDASGLVWSNWRTTIGSSYWVYLGNTTLTNANGNGIVYYEASDGTGFVFVWRNGLIDYINTSGTPTWVYGWNPSTGATGATGSVLKTTAGTNNPHEAIVAPDSKVYFTDSYYLSGWYQTAPGTPFVPTNIGTYTYFQQTALMPTTDNAQCVGYLGTDILVGGRNNILYVWDGFSTGARWVLLAEYNIKKLVTVNTNTFIFVGNRGRIYITNGSNAQLYKKIPDHISGTIEPYFTWGGATSIKNQLYFSMLAQTNDGTAISQYGGVWGIDLDTKAIRLVNKLSYGTYSGYATAIIPNFGNNPTGTGLYIGWDTGSSSYGLDTTTSTPYTGSQATIDSDLIPIGTYQLPKSLTNIEYKLTRPLVSGESIVVQARLIFNTTDTGFTTALSDSTAGHFSNTAALNFSQAQWVQFKAILNSTASSPSYVRLKQLRILGVKNGSMAT